MKEVNGDAVDENSIHFIRTPLPGIFHLHFTTTFLFSCRNNKPALFAIPIHIMWAIMVLCIQFVSAGENRSGTRKFVTFYIITCTIKGKNCLRVI